MKKLLIIAIFLSGCSFIAPVKHDPAQTEQYITLKDHLEELSCSTRKTDEKLWDTARSKAHRFTLYSQFRQDPQLENIEGIEKGLWAAWNGSSALCENKIKLINTRMEVLEKTFRGRD